MLPAKAGQPLADNSRTIKKASGRPKKINGYKICLPVLWRGGLSLAPISSFVYTDYDLIGNRKGISIQQSVPAGGYALESVAYEYDEIYQLKREKRLDNLGNTVYDIDWAYDSVGNRMSQNKNGAIGVITNYHYNDANQLLAEQVMGETDETRYIYDQNGNQVGKTKGLNTWTWTYDYENRQIVYTDSMNPANNTTYTYDAEGRRISRTNTQTLATERYLYDGANVIADYDGFGALQASYLTPMLDDNVLMERGGQKYYYLKDGLGSVRNLVDSVQSVVNSYDYYAFGEALNWTETVPNRYTYTSREWDGESQTYHHRIRNNDPRIGRFLSADPIGYDGGINLYSYVGNNPVNNTDPFGLWICNDNICKPEKKDENRHLKTLATDMGYPEEDWVCIWPNMHKPSLYPFGNLEVDEFDISNLTARSGPSLNIKILSGFTSWRWFSDFKYISNDAGVAAEIKNVSQEGKTPIKWLGLFGHGPALLTPKSLKDNAIKDDTNDYLSANQKRGPVRCWFTYDAQVRFIGCHTHNDAKSFANQILRKGAKAYGFSEYIEWGTLKIYASQQTKKRWLFPGDTLVNPRSYTTLEDFYKDNAWEKHEGTQ